MDVLNYQMLQIEDTVEDGGSTVLLLEDRKQ